MPRSGNFFQTGDARTAPGQGRDWPLRNHLALFAALLLLPSLLVVGWSIQHLAREIRKEAENRVVQLSVDLADDISLELERSLTILRTLALAHSLQQDDLAAFHESARWAVAASGDAVLLVEPSGRQLLNTAAAWGTPLPGGAATESLTQAIGTKQPVISNLFVARTRGVPVVNVLLPLIKNDEVDRILILSIAAERIHAMLRGQNLPENWINAVSDRNGMLIAHSRLHEQRVGRELPEALKRASETERTPHVVANLEGVPVIRAIARTRLSNWTVTTAVSEEHVQRAVRATVHRLAGGIAAVVLVSLGLVAFYAGRLARAFGLLADLPDRTPAPTLVREANTTASLLVAATREMQASRQSMQAAFAVAGLGRWGWDVATRRMTWAPETRMVFGLSPEIEVTPRLFLTLLHPDDVARFKASWQAAMDPGGNRRYAIEYRIRRASDDAERWIGSQAVVELEGDRPVRVNGVVRDITDEKRATEHLHMLMREVNHRAKNMLGLVLAVARQTAASSPGEFIERFSARVQGLAANQDLLVRSGWRSVALEELLRSQLEPFAGLLDDRITLDGEPLMLSATAAQGIGMALHELSTNAAKYGSLSNAAGRVAVAWRLDRAPGSEPRFLLSWTERDGPPVSPPERGGFGSIVLLQMAKMSLGAEASLAYPPEGVSWRIECPADRVLGTAPLDAAPAVATVSGSRPRVLVVEDEALVAMEIASILGGAGYDVVGPAGSTAQALALIDSPGCDLAVLDVNLGRETAETVAARLAKSGIPFLTLSGYAREQLPPAFQDAPLLGKPLSSAALVRQVKRIMPEPRPTEARPAMSPAGP